MSETEQTTPIDPDGATAPSEAPETPVEEQPTEREKEVESKFQKRIGYLRSQATQATRDRDELAARLAQVEAQLRGGGQAQAQVDPAYQQMVQAEAQRIALEQQNKAIFARFDAAGAAAYPDWQQRCNELAAWGAIPIAQAMAEMENGHRVAAALHDAPEELERIMSYPGERARAIALGKFAAKLEATPNRNVSRAPPPPKPIQGRTNPQYNTYQETDTNKLAQYYAEQAMEQRRRG